MGSAWDRLAAWRDRRTGEQGDLWHRALIDPSLRRVIGQVRGLRVLEVACGNGYLARRLAGQGATEVVGLDRSEASIRRARARERSRPKGVRFEVGDAARLPFPSGRFDLVVVNMGLMDIRDARGAVAEAARVLGPGGRLVFSIAHPCFDLDDRSLWSVERGFGSDGIYRDVVWRKVRGYREERRTRVPWRTGPRTVVWTDSYHRTLATYSRYLQEAGLVILRLEEPAPRAEMLAKSPQGAYLRDIPLHLVVEASPWRRARRGSRTRARNRTAGGRRSVGRGRSAGSGSGRPGSTRGS